MVFLKKISHPFWYTNCKVIHNKDSNEKYLGNKSESLSNVHITIQMNIVLKR